jgi:hypothetical protein
MKARKPLLIGILVLGLMAAGCDTLAEIADWTPFAVTTFDGFVSIVAPGNTSLPAEASAIAKLVTTLGTDAAAAAQAGSGLAGTQKVIAEIASINSDITAFESQLSAAGATIPANDQKYVAAGSAFVLATLEGYEAMLQEKAGTTAAAATIVDVSTPDGCAGFTPASGDPRLDTVNFVPAPSSPLPRAPLAGDSGGPYKPAHFYADCGDSGDGIDVILTSAGPVSVRGATGVAKAPPTIANWKRQFNAIAKKYGHPEKQLKLSTSDHFVHVLTLGKR